MLPAKEQVTTPTSFMNVPDNGTSEVDDTGVVPNIAAAAGDKRIVISHTQAVESTAAKIVKGFFTRRVRKRNLVAIDRGKDPISSHALVRARCCR